MKYLLMVIIVLTTLNSCDKNNCKNTLYGIPVKNTGISDEQCTPDCKCKNLESKQFSEIELTAMREYTLTNPFDEVVVNPYDEPLVKKADGVCAVIIENKIQKTYRLETFKTKEEAETAGGIVTHYDACGVCSTLEDLIVYAEKLDLGADVRLCAFYNLSNPVDSLIECIEAIGLTKPCAQVWSYNAKNTQDLCFDECISNNIYNNEDGTLSACLQCDEDKSGPIFKVEAGRTRRNTGIANAICRFCEEVQVVEHNYDF